MKKRRLRRVAVAVLGLFAGAAVFADCLAADRPIAASVSNELSLLPNITHRGDRGDSLSASLAEGDWALWAPIRYDPLGVRTAGAIEVLAPPSSEHLLGTDDRGRDVLSRLIHGTRSTLMLAISVAGLSLIIGVLLALLGALGHRWLRSLIGAAADAGSSMPIILLVVAATGLWGGGGIALAIIVIAIPRTADVVRIALAQIDLALTKPFADAARAAGVSGTRLLFRHALPNAMPQLWVATALTATLAVLAEAALSFLGFGTPPPEPSWGELLAQAHQNDLAWWLLGPAGLCAAALAGAFAALADLR